MWYTSERMAQLCLQVSYIEACFREPKHLVVQCNSGEGTGLTEQHSEPQLLSALQEWVQACLNSSWSLNTLSEQGQGLLEKQRALKRARRAVQCKALHCNVRQSTGLVEDKLQAPRKSGQDTQCRPKAAQSRYLLQNHKHDGCRRQASAAQHRICP